MDYLTDDAGNITENKDRAILDRLLRDVKVRKTYAVQ